MTISPPPDIQSLFDFSMFDSNFPNEMGGNAPDSVLPYEAGSAITPSSVVDTSPTSYGRKNEAVTIGQTQLEFDRRMNASKEKAKQREEELDREIALLTTRLDNLAEQDITPLERIMEQSRIGLELTRLDYDKDKARRNAELEQSLIKQDREFSQSREASELAHRQMELSMERMSSIGIGLSDSIFGEHNGFVNIEHPDLTPVPGPEVPSNPAVDVSPPPAASSSSKISGGSISSAEASTTKQPSVLGKVVGGALDFLLPPAHAVAPTAMGMAGSSLLELSAVGSSGKKTPQLSTVSEDLAKVGQDIRMWQSATLAATGLVTDPKKLAGYVVSGPTALLGRPSSASDKDKPSSTATSFPAHTDIGSVPPRTASSPVDISHVDGFPSASGIDAGTTTFPAQVGLGGLENPGGFAAGDDLQLPVVLNRGTDGGKSAEEASAAQHKRLTPGEIRRLKDAGIDIHRLKEYQGQGRADLFKDKAGNIISKPKSGSGSGEPTGYNIKDF